MQIPAKTRLPAELDDPEAPTAARALWRPPAAWVPRGRTVGAYGCSALGPAGSDIPEGLVAPPSVASSACPSGALARRPARARRARARPSRDTPTGPDSLSGAHRADGSASLRPQHTVPNPGLCGMERSGKSCWVCAWNCAAGRGKKDEPFRLLRP